MTKKPNLFNNAEEAAAFLKDRLGDKWESGSPNYPRKHALKGAVSLILEEDGTPELIPDDFFYRYGKPVRDWLAELEWPDMQDAFEAEAEAMASRAHAFARAYRLFIEAAENDTLRHEPWVISEYDSLNNSATFLFVFKCENNGNTYRVRWEPR